MGEGKAQGAASPSTKRLTAADGRALQALELAGSVGAVGLHGELRGAVVLAVVQVVGEEHGGHALGRRGALEQVDAAPHRLPDHAHARARDRAVAAIAHGEAPLPALGHREDGRAVLCAAGARHEGAAVEAAEAAAAAAQPEAARRGAAPLAVWPALADGGAVVVGLDDVQHKGAARLVEQPAGDGGTRGIDARGRRAGGGDVVQHGGGWLGQARPEAAALVPAVGEIARLDRASAVLALRDPGIPAGERRGACA